MPTVKCDKCGQSVAVEDSTKKYMLPLFLVFLGTAILAYGNITSNPSVIISILGGQSAIAGFIWMVITKFRSNKKWYMGKVIKRTWLPQSIASGMLLWALYPGNPSGYYTLLHWFCCGTLIYQACRAVSQKRHSWIWILGITAVVYNPIFRLHFNRELWSAINIITAGIVVVSIFTLKIREKQWIIVIRLPNWYTFRWWIHFS